MNKFSFVADGHSIMIVDSQNGDRQVECVCGGQTANWLAEAALEPHGHKATIHFRQ